MEILRQQQQSLWYPLTIASTENNNIIECELVKLARGHGNVQAHTITKISSEGLTIIYMEICTSQNFHYMVTFPDLAHLL